MKAIVSYRYTSCPTEVHGLKVDVSRGFDVMNRKGEVYEHFDSYAEAEEFRAKKRGIMRYYYVEENA